MVSANATEYQPKASSFLGNVLNHDEDVVLVDGWAPHLDSIPQEGRAVLCHYAVRPLDRYGEAFRHIVDTYQMANQREDLALAFYSEEISELLRQGKTCIVIGASSCDFMFNNIIDTGVNVFQKMGLRLTALACGTASFAADGCLTKGDGGLTKDGRLLIDACQKYGVTVDIAGASAKAATEALEYASGPLVCTHSLPKKLWDTPWSLGDDLAKRCGERGGVVGVCADNRLYGGSSSKAYLDSFIDAVAHFSYLLGAGGVALGMGFCLRDSENAYSAAPFGPFEPGQEHLEGLSGYGDISALIEGLLKRGFSKEEVWKVLGGNWLRVFGATWKSRD